MIAIIITKLTKSGTNCRQIIFIKSNSYFEVIEPKLETTYYPNNNATINSCNSTSPGRPASRDRLLRVSWYRRPPLNTLSTANQNGGTTRSPGWQWRQRQQESNKRITYQLMEETETDRMETEPTREWEEKATQREPLLRGDNSLSLNESENVFRKFLFLFVTFYLHDMIF